MCEIGTKTHQLSTSSSSYFWDADRGDLSIRVFWEGWTDTTIDLRVMNIDSKNYTNLPLANQDGFDNAGPARINVAILHLLWYRRADCKISKLNSLSRGLQSCLQKNGASPTQQKRV